MAGEYQNEGERIMSRRAIAIAVAIVACAGLAAGAFALTSFGAKSASNRVEHIGIQGHWQIVVKNPDGRIVSVHRFHNDPISAGQAVAAVLAGQYTPSGFRVQLYNTNDANSNPCVTGTFNVPCVLEPAGSNYYDSANNYVFKTMTTGVSGKVITLHGSMTAQRNGTINGVFTDLMVCSSSVAPATNCASSTFFSSFTSRTLATSDEIPLVTGQQVLVTVTLTFG